MARIKIVAWVTVVTALLAGALTLLVPAPASGSAAAFHSSLLQSVVITIVQLGAGLLFIWGLKGFKHELRVAYGIIAAGVVMLGFSDLQLPVIAYFDLSQSMYVSSGMIVIPYIAPTLLVFFGERLFAKLFNIKSIWMSFWFVMVAGVACAIAAVGLAQFVTVTGNKDFTASIVISAWTSIFLIASTSMVVNIIRVAGAVYRDALRWLVAARAVVTLTGVSYTLVLIFFGDKNFFSEYGFVLIPGVISALLILRSGYAFKLINEDPAARPAQQIVTIIDVVTFAASQASNPAALDATLDTLRAITSGIREGDHAITSEQQESLKAVYADVERYLVEKEPIRRLTAQDIRRKGAAYFGMDYHAFEALVTPMGAAGGNGKVRA